MTRQPDGQTVNNTISLCDFQIHNIFCHSRNQSLSLLQPLYSSLKGKIKKCPIFKITVEKNNAIYLLKSAMEY